ncbi:hypothetical protein [Streptosporangium sp. KLBMP 9127]|nr:hypothetical protein [Streptosporangium sp. KLBMP 9127]
MVSSSDDKVNSSNAIPSPNADEKTALMEGLVAIDAALDHNRSIDRALETCKEVRTGVEQADVVARIQERFGTNGAQINKTEAGRIKTLVEGTFCRAG